MIRFAIATAIFLGSAALGLIAASLVVDGFNVTAEGFLVTVVIYALVQSIISPFLAKVSAAHARAFLGGVGLVATFVALLVAKLFGDSVSVTGGVGTWVVATLVVWLVSAVSTWLLPLLLVRSKVQSVRGR